MSGTVASITIVRGFGVAPGIASGDAYVLPGDKLPILPEHIDAGDVDREIDRFDTACLRAREQIVELRERVRQRIGDEFAGILDVQALIVGDGQLRARTLERIRRGRSNAAWALRETVGELLREFDAIDDAYLRERGGDLADVHRRLQRLLTRRRGEPGRVLPDGRWVVVAQALGPSDAVALAGQGIVGIVTDTGGPTSHTAILAQALGVPAVAGLHDFSRSVRPGDAIVADGSTGRVALPGSADAARELANDWLSRLDAGGEGTEASPDGTLCTADGAEVWLRANVELPQELGAARGAGAQGIGLYRSEFLFLTHAPELPSEEQHYRAYRRIVEALAPHPAVIRTLDLGGDKAFHDVDDRAEPNPVLGLRAVRLCLKRPDIFRPQLRGLLRASAHGDLRILLPLVTGVEEVEAVRAMLADEARSLARSGHRVPSALPLGAMIETPAAALSADLLAEHCDFLSLGTNDLIQYALATDRGNESVAYLYRPLHPGLVRLLRQAIAAARSRDRPIGVCGEMATSAEGLEVLVGLGLRDFSVPPLALPAVRRRLRALDVATCEARAAAALEGRPSARALPPSPYKIVR